MAIFLQAQNGNASQALPFLDDAIAGMAEAEHAAISSEYLDPNSSRSGSTVRQKKLLGIARIGAISGNVSEVTNQSFESLLYEESISLETEHTATSLGSSTSNKIINKHQPLYSTVNKTLRGKNQKRKPVHEDESQALLAARANRVIGVLTVIELLLPLAPWQRRKVSIAVVESMHTTTDEDSFNSPQRNTTSFTIPEALGELHPITAHAARTAVSFLLNDCGMTHRQAAETIAEHPWLLGVQSIRTR